MKKRYDLVPPASDEGRENRASSGRLARLYASVDPRSLGLLRIALGTLLFCDVALKLPEVEAHFSNTGWLPNHFALFRPMSEHLFSVYFAFSSPLEVKLLMGVHLLVCALLAIGFRTKLMQLLALLLTTSLNSRNILIENGGSVVLDILLLWTAFLPLGRRFSVDAVRDSLKRRQETSALALNERDDPPRTTAPVVSLAVTALLLQWVVIYAFNALQKNGAPWRDGTAVYYFLQQDRLITWWGAWLRGALPLAAIQAATYAALAIEALVPLLLLMPYRSGLMRMLAFALVLALHLSIDSVLQLGSFSWAMLVPFLAFVPSDFWVRAAAWLRSRRVPCVVHLNPHCGASLVLCRLLKRVDALGLITFRALDEASPRKAEQSFCVSIRGEKSVAGTQALLAVGDALWCGRLPVRLLLSLGLRRRVERRLRQLAVEPEVLDADFGVEHLPEQADKRAPEPTLAARAGARMVTALREAAVAFLLVVCGTQVLLENPAVPAALKPRNRPALFEAIITYPRIFQGWSMFAPAPPQSDGRLVIDGRTKDGRHLDPLTGEAPVFEVHPAGSPRQNLIWGYFHLRIVEERFRTYWGGVRDFLMNHHKLSGRAQDELVGFDAYYVTQQFAPPGAKQPAPEKRRLFGNGPIPPAPRAPASEKSDAKQAPHRAR